MGKPLQKPCYLFDIAQNWYAVCIHCILPLCGWGRWRLVTAQWLSSRFSPLRKPVLTKPWITTVGGAVHTNHCFWMKTANTWKPQGTNVLEAQVGQRALLSIKGYIIRWLFNNVGNFSTWCYVFLLAEKRKSSRQPTAYITWTMSFPSWKCFCPNSPGRKVKRPMYGSYF